METDWIEHRRADDGERLGWMKPDGEGFIVVDLFGRERSSVVDWLTAEETLELIGLSYLADPYEYRLDDDSWLRVRVVEVSSDGLRVKKDDWGDMTVTPVYFTVPYPPSADVLRPLRP